MGGRCLLPGRAGDETHRSRRTEWVSTRLVDRVGDKAKGERIEYKRGSAEGREDRKTIARGLAFRQRSRRELPALREAEGGGGEERSARGQEAAARNERRTNWEAFVDETYPVEEKQAKEEEKEG